MVRTVEAKRTWGTEEKPFHLIVTQDPAPNDNFLIGFGFIPSLTHSPPNNAVPKKLLKIQHCLGWEGGGC